MTGLVLVALIPFAALGIGLGHLLNDDAAGPAIGWRCRRCSPSSAAAGSRSPAAACSSRSASCCRRTGWCRPVTSGWAPSNPWGIEAWLVIAVWTVGAAALAMWAYRRDTRRA